MNRIKEIAKLLDISEAEAEKVLEEMEMTDLNFSECEQVEFDDCARSCYNYLHRYDPSAAGETRNEEI